MMPIVGRCIDRIDAKRFDGIDDLQQTLDLRPTGQPQQNVATRQHIGHGRAGPAGRDSPQISTRDVTVPKSFDVHARIREYATRLNERMRRRLSRICSSAACRSDPFLDALLKPQQLDMREIAHAVPPS